MRPLLLACLLAGCVSQEATVPCNAVLIQMKDQPHAYAITLGEGSGLILANRGTPQVEIDHECGHINGTLHHPKGDPPSYTDALGNRVEQHRNTLLYRGNGPTHGPFPGDGKIHWPWETER